MNSATLVRAEGPVPEFCLVEGLINPEVRFEVALPSRWNGRFYMFGNGGFAGEQLAAPVRIQRRSEGLKAGFAVAQTNTGHDNAREPLASFAGSPQKLIDFAYRAVHVTTLTAKTLIGRYYASPPNKSYFAGCSTGGRQGLMSAQRFPADFDGILAGAPVFNFTGILTQFTVAQRALASSTLDPDTVRFLSDAVVKKCDAVDGVTDGVIDDPRACSFNPATDVRACAAGENGPSCLTSAETNVFDAFQKISSSQGEVFPAFPTATAILAPHGTFAGTTPGFWLGPQAGSLRFAENFFRDMAIPGTPIDWKTFNVSTDMGKLQATAAVMNATDPDLDAFRRRGGKLLMYHGWAEPQINPVLSVATTRAFVKRPAWEPTTSLGSS